MNCHARDWLYVATRSRMRVIDVIDAACAASGLERTEITGDCRSRDVVDWRTVVSVLCRRHLTHSFPHIARVMGGRDHTTIMHHLERYRRLGRERFDDRIGVTEAQLRLQGFSV